MKAGHTLRLIHKRLNMAGVPIGYKLLVIYRGRIEREKLGIAFPNIPVRSASNTSPAFDPVANLRAQEQKRWDGSIRQPSRRKQAFEKQKIDTAMPKSLMNCDPGITHGVRLICVETEPISEIFSKYAVLGTQSRRLRAGNEINRRLYNSLAEGVAA
jgi:hypothetical protein